LISQHIVICHRSTRASFQINQRGPPKDASFTKTNDIFLRISPKIRSMVWAVAYLNNPQPPLPQKNWEWQSQVRYGEQIREQIANKFWVWRVVEFWHPPSKWTI